MITAEDVKRVIRSLLSKINKETGKKHNTLSEGVETLVLGYGSGNVEPWDGRIKIDGEIAEEVTDYFELGKAEGYQNGYTEGYDKCTEDMQDDLQAKYDEGYDYGHSDGYNSAIENMPDGDAVRYGYDS